MAIVKRWLLILGIALSVSAILTCSEDGPTGPHAPFTIVSTSPADGDTSVEATSFIVINFSEAADPSSLDSESIAIDPEVRFVVLYDTTLRAAVVHVPLGFQFDRLYTVSVNATIRSAGGDTLLEPRQFSFRTSRAPSGAWYVAYGGTGDGSKAAPMGSLQAAVDSAALDPGRRLIYLAGGEHIEMVTISTPVTIIGGCDPSADWEPYYNRRTRIRGGGVEGHGVGMAVTNVQGTVQLRNLDITPGGAQGSGHGSYGLICSDVDSMQFSFCYIRASRGADGSDGGWGSEGWSLGGKGGQGGAGDNAYFGDLADSGSAGQCPGGGEGGLGGAPYSPGQQGGNGADGESGVGGSSGLTIVTVGGLPMIKASDGMPGASGAGGCGGGGAGGGSCSRWYDENSGEWYDIPGCPGDSGGVGGLGGAGGGGGDAGGCSVGILCSNSVLMTRYSSFWSDRGGDGGDGGEGMSGREGPMKVVYFCPPGYSMIGFLGGRGGTGGYGGNGGAGAGGWSIGIAFINGGTIAGDMPGVGYSDGGGKGGHGVDYGPGGGADGQEHFFYTLPQ